MSEAQSAADQLPGSVTPSAALAGRPRTAMSRVLTTLMATVPTAPAKTPALTRSNMSERFPARAALNDRHSARLQRARGLGLVQKVVSAREHLLRGLRPVPRRHTDGDRLSRGHRTAQALDHPLVIRAAARREDDGELVAA